MKKRIFKMTYNGLDIALSSCTVRRAPYAVLFLLFFSSCTNHYKELTRLSDSPKKVFPSIFENKEKATVFDASFTYKTYFSSGLMIIKPLENNHFRIVFTAKMGQTLLDTELTPTDFIIKKTIPQLNRKLLLNLLEKDLRLICDSHSGRATAFQNTATKKEVYRLKTKKGFRYFYYDETGSIIEKIERGSKLQAKVIVDLENYRDNFPEKITFVHQKVSLKIEMQVIKRK